MTTPGHRLRPTRLFKGFDKEAVEQSIVARFEEQVDRAPGRLAVSMGEEELTYAALDAAANRVAHAVLAARGSTSEPVAILVEQGPGLVAAILGVLKAGKFYVPLERALPLSWLRDVARDAEPALIVADAGNLELGSRFTTDGAAVLALGDAAVMPAERPGVRIAPGARAYIYYTSGSTGRPKGVVDCHRNALHNVMRYTNSLYIAPDDRLTLLQSASFSGAVSSLFGALSNGAAVFPFDVRAHGVDAVAPWLARERITIYHSVPSLFRRVASAGVPFPALRLVRLEGDQASLRDVELYRAHCPDDCVLVNGLGATECGLVRQYFIDKATRVSGATVPIGGPVPDMEVLLLDETAEGIAPSRLNDGAVCGEIAVRSRYLAEGYWKRPDLTAAAFAPDPSGGDARTYRSGDLGRMSADDTLEHLGRKTFERKIRGQRVDVASIEAALLELPAVHEAVVVTRDAESDRPDAPDEPRLVAYVVPVAGATPTVTALRGQLAARLPGAMVPTAWVLLDALPLTTNGKVDRRALPAPARARPPLDVTLTPPRTPTETTLADIWREVLDVEPIGVDDHFLDLGGDSLLATQVIGRLRLRLGVDLSVGVLFDAPTVASLALAVARQVEASGMT